MNGSTSPVTIPVFRAGEGGFHTYRIPSLLRTRSGVLLAFAEGRKDGPGDAGAIHLILRRSLDGGNTWGPMQTVWSDGPNTCGNPCPVRDDNTGTIVLLMTHNLGQDREKDIMAGKSVGTRTVWVTRSENDGQTWTTPNDITAAVKPDHWGWYATGPGVGIQIQNGSRRGRMVVPCDHSDLKTGRWTSHSIYSDNGGKTWNLGGSCPNVDTNECQAAELPGGTLLLNMRSGDPAKKVRSVCESGDGGQTWSQFRYDETLIEPICQASLLAVPDTRKPVLLFANPASQTHRVRLTVRASRDNGKTWPESLLIHAGPAAYSCLALLPDGTFGCLFECGKENPYETIAFARFSPEDFTRSGGNTQPANR